MEIQLYRGFSAYYHRSAVIILLVGFLVRLAIAIGLYPGFDEAYYYLYTLHPDWSYFDHPPLVALTTNLGIWLTGGIVSQLTIRIGTLLLYTGALIFLYLAALRLFTLQIAINTLAIASAIPIFQVAFGTLNIPDTPLMFFWAITLWLATQEFFDHRAYRPSFRLTLMCLTIGLACMGKYHGFMLGFGLLGFCAFSPTYRRALTSKWFGLGIVVFLLTIAPLLYWNINHDWVSFKFQSERAVPDRRYHLDRVLINLGVECLYLFPTFGLPLLWTIARTSIQQAKNFDLREIFATSIYSRSDWNFDKRALLLWLSLPLVLVFSMIAGYQQILPTWKMPGYWTATMLLAERIALSRRFTRVRLPYRWFFGSAIAIAILLGIALSHLSVGAFQAPGNKINIFGLAKVDDTSTQIFDVSQLQRGLVANKQLNAAFKQTDFVFTNRYFLGGQIGMAIEPPFHKPLTCFDADLRGFAFWSKPQQWVGKNAIYLGSKTFQVDDEAQSIYAKYFSKITKIGEVPIRRGGAVVETFSVYRAQKMLKPFPRPYGK